MKKKLPLMVLFLLAVFALQFVCHIVEKTDIASLEDNMAYHSDGLFYLLKNSGQSSAILGIDNAGKIKTMYFTASLGSTKALSLRLGGISSHEGSLYLVREYIQRDTKAIIKQEILEFKQEPRLTSKPRILYTFEGEALPHITAIGFEQSIIHISAVSQTGKTAYDYQLDKENLQIAKTIRYEAQYGDGFLEAVWSGGDTYVTTKSGEISNCTSYPRQVVFAQNAQNPLTMLRPLGGSVVFAKANPAGVYTYEKISKSAREIFVQEENQKSAVISSGNFTGANEYILKSTDAKTQKSVLIISDKTRAGIIQNISYSPMANIIYSLWGTLLIGLPALALALIIYVCAKILAQRKTLLTKITLGAAALFAAAFGIMGAAWQYSMNNYAKDMGFSLAREISAQTKRSLNTADIAALSGTADYKSNEYQSLLNSIYEEETAQNKTIIKEILTIQNGEIYMGVSPQNPRGYPIGLIYKNNSIAPIKAACEDKADTTAVIWDSMGKWYGSIDPIAAHNGEVSALLLVRVSAEPSGGVGRGRTFFVIAAFAVILAAWEIIFVLVKKALLPLDEIMAAMNKISKGDYSYSAAAPTRDEFYSIKKLLGKMCEDLAKNTRTISLMSKSYYRFVPRKINEILGKDSILDVNFGDVKSLRVSVAIASLNNRDKIRNDLNDRAFMDFVNDYFYIVNDSIENSGGIIISNDFNTSAIKSIYTGGNIDALSASINFIERSKNLKIPDCQMKTDSMAIIHNTEITYGVAGSKERAFPFLLSSEIDFLATLTEKFKRTGTKLVVTQNALKGIENKYSSRCIGFVHSADAKHMYNLYEIFDVYDKDDQKLYEHNNAGFKQALNLFYHNNFYLARNIFSQILRTCPADGITRWYLFACDKYFNSGEQAGISYELFGTDSDIYA